MIGFRDRPMYGKGMKPFFFGLLRPRECMVPTLRGWLLILLVTAGVGWAAASQLYSFLAVNAPVEGGALVIEGWAPDYAYSIAITEFKRRHCDKLYVTGGPVDRGSLLSEYKTYAEVGDMVLLRMGMNRESVEAVPAPGVRMDRTYASALALRDRFQSENKNITKINVISLGVHARRSRLLFEKAFGRDLKIGIIALEDQDYDPARWWAYSTGVRSVVDELVAYCYARFLFFKGS